MSFGLNLVGSQQDIVVMLGETQITGRNFIVNRVDMSVGEPVSFMMEDGRREYLHPSSPMSIDISLTGYPDALETMMSEQKRKISSKIVRDATIPELLFAVRKKIENGG